MTDTLTSNNTSKFFQLGISVNCAIFVYDGEGLKVLIIDRKNEPFAGESALPGKLISPEENLEQTVDNIVREATGMEEEVPMYFKQLRAFVDTDRHPMGRVISIAYLCLIRYNAAELKESSIFSNPNWQTLADKPSLVFDHDDILVAAQAQLKEIIRNKPVAFQMLEQEFSLPQLQSIYENILEIQLDKRNFRRKLRDMPFIEDTGEFQKIHQYRPARLYRYNASLFKQMKKEEGFVFSL